MSEQTRYLILYTPKHSKPIARLEYQQSKGSRKLRNLRWLKDRLHLEASTVMEHVIEDREIYGYVSKVSYPAKLPRNTHRNIIPEYIPVRMTTKELVACLCSQSPE
jgi:hypothetical protein